jgi:phospholipid/cholesterol/gamma-HCH transport system substrate-binding protein
MSRNSTTVAAAVKLGVFTLASVLVTGLLAVIMGKLSFADSNTYRAVFTSASMLQPGDEVRVAGIYMGEVEEVEISGRTRALVTFSVRSALPLTTSTRAEIRYLNLVGDRYLALERGKPGGARLVDEATIPIARTAPALDLTTLFNGFQPLFAALSPEDVNDLSLNLVRTLQGESGNLESLLAHTASLTSSLADRDQLIGQVVTNLNAMLGTVDSRHEELTELVKEMRRWVGGLSQDRKAIGSSIGSVAELTEVTASLLAQGRPLIKDDVAELRKLSRTLAEPRNQALLRELLRRVPESMTDQTRTGTYGSWYNYYLCDFRGRILLPALKGPGVDELQRQLNSLAFHSDAARCQDGRPR